METNDTLKKAGLAAVILLAPGGFILGATLAARHWRKRQAEKAETSADETNEPCASGGESGVLPLPDSGPAGGGAEGETT